MTQRLTLEELYAKRDELQKQQDANAALIKERLGETLVMCSQDSNGKGCGMGAMIKDLTYIQTHWYVPPRGCTEGDYWKAGEGQWQCGHCKKINRLYGKPEIEKLSSAFKNIELTYPK